MDLNDTDTKPLVIKNLSKSFGGIQALTDVNFSVNLGERLVVIGPNGAGKTTLFNLITGSFPPTLGRIYIFNEDATEMLPQRRAHLGMARTFQITNIFPNLTLHENILLAVQGMSPRSLRFTLHRPVTSYRDVMDTTEKLISKWDLQGEKHVLVRNLSYGEQRQIEVVMALAAGARMLLLDEPCAGLSPAETRQLTSMILNLDPSMTLIIIEHDMDVAFQLAHRLIVMFHGRILADGPLEKIKVDPKVKEIYLGAN